RPIIQGANQCFDRNRRILVGEPNAKTSRRPVALSKGRQDSTPHGDSAEQRIGHAIAIGMIQRAIKNHIGEQTDRRGRCRGRLPWGTLGGWKKLSLCHGHRPGQGGSKHGVHTYSIPCPTLVVDERWYRFFATPASL